MSAPQDNAVLLLRAQDTLARARYSSHGLRLIGEGLISVDPDASNAIISLANIVLKRLDKAERKIERYRKGAKPTQGAP